MITLPSKPVLRWPPGKLPTADWPAASAHPPGESTRHKSVARAQLRRGSLEMNHFGAVLRQAWKRNQPASGDEPLLGSPTIHCHRCRHESDHIGGGSEVFWRFLSGNPAAGGQSTCLLAVCRRTSRSMLQVGAFLASSVGAEKLVSVGCISSEKPREFRNRMMTSRTAGPKIRELGLKAEEQSKALRELSKRAHISRNLGDSPRAQNAALCGPSCSKRCSREHGAHKTT